MRPARSVSGVAPVLAAALACNAPAHEGFTTVSFGTTDATTASTAPDNGDDPTAAPTGGPGSTTGTGTTGTPENVPPEIGAFSVTPDAVAQAQAVTLDLEASADVVSVELFF